MPGADTSVDAQVAEAGPTAVRAHPAHPPTLASPIADLSALGDTPTEVLARLTDWLSVATGASAALAVVDGVSDRWVLTEAGRSPGGDDLPPDRWNRIIAEAGLPAPSHDTSPVQRRSTPGGLELTVLPLRREFAILVLGESAVDQTLLDLAAMTAEILVSRSELKAELRGLTEEQIEIARLLAIRDVDQLLLSTVNTANRLIDADMAGVMLGDHNDLIMECCVGNRSRRTEQLRFAKGQGVAGLVMERAAPCKVDDYLASELITHDFDSLARVEETRSALAAPLIVDGVPIGVLEVWRRRPSVFTEANVRQMVTLANLAAIAIDNARLHAQRAESLDQLAQTTTSMTQQLNIMEHARSIQTTLSHLLLEGEGVDSISRTIGTRLDAQIAILSTELEVLGTWPRAMRADYIVERVRSAASSTGAGLDGILVELEPGRWLTAQPVQAGSDHRGWFCTVLSGPPSIGEELVIGEAVTVTALCQLMERAAEEARIGEREALVWDLIEGPIGQRRAAIDRARWLRVDLDRSRRLVRGEIRPSGSSRRERWDEAEYEKARRRVLSRIRTVAMRSGSGDLVAMRGNELAVILTDASRESLRQLVTTLDDAAVGVLPGHRVAWGVSGQCPTMLDLDQACSEAMSAARATARLGLGMMFYEDLGVVRLIVSDDDGDLSHFLRDIIGPLLHHDTERGSELVDTLRAYFSSDYSHRDAAKRLHIHHKTFRYRLTKIEELTGIDLRSHEGRMRADLALKLLDVTGGHTGENERP